MKPKTLIQRQLYAKRDAEHRRFIARLVPTIDKRRIIGIRMPVLRSYAKLLDHSYPQLASDFLTEAPHKFLEESVLHALVISQITNTELAIAALNNFVPTIDNWLVCDVPPPAILKTNPEATLTAINNWLSNDNPYAIRYAIKLLLTNFLTDDYVSQAFELVTAINHDDYYVKMVQAWFYAEACVNYSDQVIATLSDQTLPTWVHNKVIAKVSDSRRVTPETTAILRSLRLPSAKLRS